MCSNEPEAGTSVHASFTDVGRAATTRPRAAPVIARSRMLREYCRALKAAQATLREDTAAVLAQADRALAHAQRCRRERARRS